MNSCKIIRRKMVEAVYSDLPEDEQKQFLQHLDSCADCRREFAILQKTLGIMNKRQIPDPGEDYWGNYWQNLQHRLIERNKTNVISEWVKKLFAFLNVRMPGYAPQLAAAAVILVVGIFIGKFYFANNENSMISDVKLIQSLQDKTPVRLSAQRYLEKSKIILLGLVNFDPTQDDPYALNLDYQKEISQQMAFQAKTLKKSLADSGLVNLAELIEQLEIIMLQIANLEERHDLQGIDLIKSTVNSNGILLQINLEELQLAAPESERAQNKI